MPGPLRCLMTLAWLLCLPWQGVQAQPLAPASAALQWEIALWSDPSGQAQLSQLRTPEGRQLFHTWDRSRGEVNLSYSPGALWLRLRVNRPAELPALWVMEVPFHGLKALQLHLPDGRLLSPESGSTVAPQQLEHRFPAFALELDEGINELHLRVSSHGALTVPIRFWLPRQFLAHVQSSTLLQALYFGGLAAMLIYNLFLAISLRDRRFASYVLFVATLGLAMLSGNGYGRLLLWPQAHAFDAVAQSFFLCLCAGFSIAFSSRFMQLDRHQRRLHRTLQVGQGLMFGFALLLLASTVWPLDRQWLQMSLTVAVPPLGLLIMWAAMRSVRAGVRGIRFFLLAWSALWLGVFVASFRLFGWLPSNTLTMYAIQIASAVEMLLLALALAEIVHQERAQREQAQALALRLQNQMLMQLRESEDQLERAVRERTGQLEDALARQREVLDQYVRFGALISHEFRNPLGIIQSQASLVRKLLPDDAGMGQRLESIVGATRRLKHLFDRWLQGGRLHQLGADLRMEPLHLWPWLQDLLAAYPQYTAQHRVVLDPGDGTASAAWVRVDEALLESAVINLLDNACKYSPAHSEVRLSLERQPGQIGLAVQDQGPGIAPQMQSRIFDENVRLQPEGPTRGLGLGLALVRRIAELLQGSIKLHSHSGQGSRFTLWLPEHTPPGTP